MATKLLSTDAKRKAMAKFVSTIATEVMNCPVELVRCKWEFSRDEYKFRVEDLETDKGKVHHVTIDVCPRGVNIHTKFAIPSAAPMAANPHSGKWNHYIWPDHEDTAESYREFLHVELRRLLRHVRFNGLVRQECPSGAEYWGAMQAEFLATLEARNSAA